METNHFVLVHGGGFGAWCWYKTIALLEEGGYKVTVIELTGSGIHSFDTNSVKSLHQYVKPLIDFFEKLADGEKVIFSCHFFTSFHAFLLLFSFLFQNYNYRSKMGKPSEWRKIGSWLCFTSLATQDAIHLINQSI